jgi:hypothetical protein
MPFSNVAKQAATSPELTAMLQLAKTLSTSALLEGVQQFRLELVQVLTLLSFAQRA